MLASALSSYLAFRFGAPLLLLFLAIGLAAGVDGFGIHFDNAPIAYFIGSLGLAIVLFDSGFGTSLRSFRIAAAPAITLATLGVLITAALFAVAARFALGISWLESFLLGAIVSSTDAAAVFFLLRIGGITIKERVRATLEVESGSNDPMAVFLTIALVEWVAAGERFEFGVSDILLAFGAQLGLGLVGGIAGGAGIIWLVNRFRTERGLTPIFVIALSLLVFSLTGFAGGSGFLAVYVAGLWAGNHGIIGGASIKRFQDGLTWLAQIVMFLTLGLFATPSQFGEVAIAAIFLALILMLVARPVAVWLCLLPFRFNNHETGFLAWVGLRGAVSILLALLPLLNGLPNATALFNTVFIVVLVSLLVQGWTISPMARRLGLIVPKRTGPIEKVELELPGTNTHELLIYRVIAGSPVERGVALPRWARPSLVIRNGVSMPYREAGELMADDRVYLFVAPNYPRLLDRLFASRTALEPDDEEFFGEFALDPNQSVGGLLSAYGISADAGDAHMSIGSLMSARLGGTAIEADRVSLGPVELIVRDVDEHGAIASVGLLLLPVRPEQGLPVFANARELYARFKAWRQKPLAKPQ